MTLKDLKRTRISIRTTVASTPHHRPCDTPRLERFRSSFCRSPRRTRSPSVYSESKSQREPERARESESQRVRQTDRQTDRQRPERQRDRETAHAQSSRLSSHGRKSPTRLQRTHVDCLSEQSTLDKPSALSSAQACLFLGSREQPGRGSTAQCSAFLQW